MGDRLMDEGTERSYYDASRAENRNKSGLYGSFSSRDQPRDNEELSSPLTSDLDYRRSVLGNNNKQQMNVSRQESNNSNSVVQRGKKLSLFDEYEKRGDVLEGYEDLNADDQDNDDHVLSQIVFEQLSDQSPNVSHMSNL